jgi:hypothetical protein
MGSKTQWFVAAALLAVPAVGLAQSATDHPDFTGVWGIYRGGRGADAKFAPPAPSPLVLEIETTASDPKSWKGEWKWTKNFKRMDDTDITEAECLPNVNDHLPSTRTNLKGFGLRFRRMRITR